MNTQKQIVGDLGLLEFTETADGSLSIKSHYYDEQCHSIDGAKSETIYNFIEGCQLATLKEKHQPLVVFEVGLGMGYGLDCTLDLIGDHPLLFISTEIEEKLITYIRDQKDHPLFKNLTLDQHGHYSSVVDQQKFIILKGDATETAKNLSHYLGSLTIHAIFQDAFSPRKNPELWTEQWFHTLFGYAHQDCILSTYSSTTSVREALKTSGWKVYERAGFGKKKHATIATITAI